MNKDVKVLDCTLRDGGYVNNWNFGHSTIRNIYQRLDAAGVEFIELGFLDDRCLYDSDRTIMPNTDSINAIFRNITKKNAIPVAMIDYGTCSLDNIGPAELSFIDGIRVIFKKERIDEALPFCQALKDKGYKLFIQAISITAYDDIELLNYVERINKIKPYAFSIVDTYGLLDNKTMARYFYLVDNNLDPEICMGYHEHNNFQLGFSNTMKFLEKESTRTLIADSTIYGMGKSAGNCPTELLTMQLNSYYQKDYKLSNILELIDTEVQPLFRKYFWGYNLEFYISAMQKCHPSYVQYLLEKKTLSISSVNEILSEIPDNKKLLYDKDWISQAYIRFQSHMIDDSDGYKNLRNLINENRSEKILLVGPGSSILKYSDELKTLMSNQEIFVISTNFVSQEILPDLIFISNSKRYAKAVDYCFENNIERPFVITSNISTTEKYADIILNYETLLFPDVECSDNSLLLLLQALINVEVSEVLLAGFDGFNIDSSDYFDERYSFSIHKKETFNSTLSKALSTLNRKIKLTFITSTKYVIE